MMDFRERLERGVLKATREGFGEGMMELGKIRSDVVAVCADLSESMKIESFAKTYPERYVECGVAEQNMMGVSAGLALSGKIPFAVSYAVFNPGRNWDQLRVSVCYTNLPVRIIGGHTGVSVGPDGATHQALEDIAITRVLPNMTVLVPMDAEQARRLTVMSADLAGPVYIRLTRPKTMEISERMDEMEIGKVQVLKQGRDLTVFVCGPVGVNALSAAYELEEEGKSVEVVNIHTVKPLDVSGILASVRKTKRVMTVEEHQIVGGMGSAVCEVLAEECPVKVKRIGINDSFGESGEPEELLEKYGLGIEILKEGMKRMIDG